jgi:uncharacterized membrane protein required for colicin V production
MVSLSLDQKRVIAGIYLVMLIICAGSYYLGWGLFRGADRKVLAVVTFVGLLVAAKYGPALVEELREYRRRNRG